MDIEINEVHEIIKNLEGGGELSIKEEKYLKVAKLCVHLAAENVGLKQSERELDKTCAEEFGQDLVSEFTETPATDRIVAGIKADGVEEWVSSRGGRWNGTTEEALKFAKQLREGGQMSKANHSIAKALKMASRQTAFESAREEILADLQLAELALSAMDSEPVAEVVSIYGDPEDFGEREIRPLVGIQQMPYGTKLYRHAQPAPVVPNGLRLALSNAGIAAPESDEMLAATCEKHIQALVTWVKGRKPFQSAPVVPTFDEWLELSGNKPLGWVKDAMRESYDACRAAMLNRGKS